MLTKFTLTCKVCGCKMQFAPREQAIRAPITCQNCGQQLSDNDFTLVTNAMTALKALPHESIIDGCYVPEQEGFKFKIEIAPSPISDSEG